VPEAHSPRSRPGGSAATRRADHDQAKAASSTADDVTVGVAASAAAALLQRAGVPADDARLTARCIVTADAWGIPSHGLMRLPYYLARLSAGGVRPVAELRLVADTGPLLVLDGNDGLGHWQLWRAAELARDRAAVHGIAAAAVRRSSHCGALGIYTWPALDAGKLTLLFSNGPAVMPAWGGERPVLSTSPIAAGIPTLPVPTIVDLATSAVARGKIATAAQAGSPIPSGWAFDGDGQPTTDPAVALRGMLAPLGGAKGYALALVVEALTAGLVGPLLSADIPDMFAAEDAALPQQISHLVITLDPARFGSVDGPDAHVRLDDLAGRVRDSGGRLPGGSRTAPGQIPADTPIALSLPIRELLSQATP